MDLVFTAGQYTQVSMILNSFGVQLETPASRPRSGARPNADMAERLPGKTAIVVGAGQTPGETIGNGRAMAVLFAREGARVLCVDRLAERAEETVAAMIAARRRGSRFRADVSRRRLAAIARAGEARWGASTSWSTMSASAAPMRPRRLEHAGVRSDLRGQPQGHVAGVQGRHSDMRERGRARSSISPPWPRSPGATRSPMRSPRQA